MRFIGWYFSFYPSSLKNIQNQSLKTNIKKMNWKTMGFIIGFPASNSPEGKKEFGTKLKEVPRITFIRPIKKGQPNCWKS